MNNRGETTFKEILFILSQFIPTVIMWVCGFYPLAIAFTIWGILFCYQEFMWNKCGEGTISQYFWKVGKNKKFKAVIIVIAMAVQWAFLIHHLIWPVFFGE